ncbi:DPEP2 neighbor protein [Thomomys bottae]
MSDRIFYIHSNMSSVPWESSAAAVPPVPPPTPVYYHVLYQGYGETQMGWHGETYCLVGGYRLYGDAPLATPAKTKTEKPAPRQAPKRHRAPELDEDLSCPSPKIRPLNHGGRRLTPQKLAKRASLLKGQAFNSDCHCLPLEIEPEPFCLSPPQPGAPLLFQLATGKKV